MNVTVKNAFLNIEGRAVPYTELEVLGDKHTLSVRKYPKNVSVVMWKNKDKSGTKVLLKLPHDKFNFEIHVFEIIENFDTGIDDDVMNVLEDKWNRAVQVNNF